MANSGLSWLIQLPDAIEILCSTAEAGAVVTECSATCINYTDSETKEVRRSFTSQFLFARLLYAGMQE